MSYIILRDIPKQSVQLDLLVHQIQGGFRGFREVPPGFHYGAILDRGEWRNFWCYLSPETVLVKRFDADQQQLVDETPEQTAQYSQLAHQNALDMALVPYPANQWQGWHSITQYITTDSPILHKNAASDFSSEFAPNHPSRFEQNFRETHHGNIADFLEEFQFAFLCWLMSLKGEVDLVAQQRWSSLLNGMYNAGEFAIASHPDLFSQFVDALLPQLDQIPPEAFTQDSIVCTHLDDFIEDMNDSENMNLKKKARILLNYITKRKL
ncbi:hypothetical protein [Lyngbya sp. CCY1209]|uniref:hypothetical protein n=1 Tax=Lyngbya sp. CCY1209 TaxID=2886103 RepID=UPI002D209F55|nr:hypothetical protein [Lyngbya sp. CCY1209]MEB3885548.1 AAR2 splicing factor family protein [Lyngbya sp. CCY1209]